MTIFLDSVDEATGPLHIKPFQNLCGETTENMDLINIKKKDYKLIL